MENEVGIKDINRYKYNIYVCEIYCMHEFFFSRP